MGFSDLVSWARGTDQHTRPVPDFSLFNRDMLELVDDIAHQMFEDVGSGCAHILGLDNPIWFAALDRYANKVAFALKKIIERRMISGEQLNRDQRRTLDGLPARALVLLSLRLPSSGAWEGTVGPVHLPLLTDNVGTMLSADLNSLAPAFHEVSILSFTSRVALRCGRAKCRTLMGVFRAPNLRCHANFC